MSGLASARAAARALLEHLGVDSPEHIRLEDIAWHLGAEVVEGSVDGADARLTVRGPYARIRVRTDRGKSRARFSIAHEIGHLLLHRDRLQGLGTCDLDEWRSDKSLESEANAFAAELLLPSPMLEERCHGEPSLELVRELSLEFETSLTAAAVGFARISEVPCAVVQSEQGKVKWTMRGRGFAGTLVGRDRPVPPESAAFRCLGGAPDYTTRLPAAVWIPAAPHGLELVEHATAQPEYSAALSLVWHGEAPA